MDLRDDLLYALSGWDLAAQLASINEIVALRQMANGEPGSNYPCTDSELACLGIITAVAEHPEGEAVHTFPSGATVYLGADRDSEESYRVEGRVEVEDLPDYIADWVYRMPSAEQPARERGLAIHWPKEVEHHDRWGLPWRQIRESWTREVARDYWRRRGRRMDKRLRGSSV